MIMLGSKESSVSCSPTQAYKVLTRLSSTGCIPVTPVPGPEISTVNFVHDDAWWSVLVRILTQSQGDIKRIHEKLPLVMFLPT